MLQKASSYCYWPYMRKDIRTWVESCTECGLRNRSTRPNRADLVPSLPSYPLERIALDVIGPLPETNLGNRYILVISDYFTKWVEAFAISDQKAETIVSCLIDQFICRYGLPGCIHSDQGSNFESLLFKKLLHYFGVRKTRTTPYHPQSDGLVERFNRTLIDMITKVKGDKCWDAYIPYVLSAYRSSKQATSGYTPNMLMFGRETRFAGCWSENELTDVGSYAESMLKRLQKAYAVVRSNYEVSTTKMRSHYSSKVHGSPFKQGDDVYLYKEIRQSKLDPFWEGPFKVIKVELNNNVYTIRRGGKEITVHFDKLKRAPDIYTRTCWGAKSQEPVNTETLIPEESGEEEGFCEKPLSGNNLPLEKDNQVELSHRPKREIRKPSKFDDFVCDWTGKGGTIRTEDISGKVLLKESGVTRGTEKEPELSR